MFFAFMSYKRRFVEAMDNLVSQLIELKMLGLHLERIGDIALTRQEACLTPEAEATESPGAGAATASLSAQALGFRYSDIDPYIFENLSFTIHPGETVAIVGPSGLGKTTLLKCLMGLLQPCDGVIRLGDVSLSNIPGYRRCIGAVLQDDQLLSGSIAENIACFDNDLNLEKVQSCAEMACIHEDIARLPMQYNTPVGDMGSALSGGQVQRIMLARAFYRQPAILFLDEATSHLDIETERRINQHIAAMHITRVMVAHRPETIALADTVIELRRDCRETVSRNGA
jgi:ATP-binding cassette subfamily B protein RaxB